MIGLALLLLAAAQPSEPPAVAIPPGPTIEDAYRERGFSEAGIAVLTRKDWAARAELRRQWKAYEDILIELRTAMRESHPDFRRIAELMRKRDAAMERINSARTERVIALFDALPPADRILYLRFFDLGPSADTGPWRGPPLAPPAPPAPPRR